MDIQTSTVKKLVLTKVPNLDSISVYLEDFGSGKGNIVISCYNQSWSFYWGAMGEYTLSKFITTCDNHYLAKKLNPNVTSEIYDEEGFENYAQKHIIQLRKEDSITRERARELYDQCWLLSDYKDTDTAQYSEIMFQIFGDEWYEFTPQKPNPEYNYFCRILDAVKEALKQ